MRAQAHATESSLLALLHLAGIPGPVIRTARLSGGGNNRAYRVDTQSGPILLKQYFQHPDDSRDRVRAEYAFLSFCRDCSVARVPRPLAVLYESGLALYSWIEGTSLASGAVTDADVAEAAAFVGELARASRMPTVQCLAHAADSCFAIQEHVERVEKRLEGLSRALAPVSGVAQDDVAREAADLVNDSVIPAWRAVRAGIEEAVPDAMRKERLTAQACIASPSDFGFHNALRTEEGLVFLDFEYAGLDDPAKLLCDFICQPAVPAPSLAVKSLQKALEEKGADAGLQHRLDLLLPVHRLKWCCIMLNEFKQIDAQRRHFAKVHAQDLRTTQLRKAKQYFETYCH